MQNMIFVKTGFPIWIDFIIWYLVTNSGLPSSSQVSFPRQHSQGQPYMQKYVQCFCAHFCCVSSAYMIVCGILFFKHPS
jgi:hypothetical protein